MFYSEDVIEEVRSRTDIVDLISGYVRLTKKGENYTGLCPFHNERTPSFTVSGAKQMYYCFGCKAGGSAITFLMKHENMGFTEAIKTLADKAGLRLPEEESGKARMLSDQRTRLFEINREAAHFFYEELNGAKGSQARTYLIERGLSENTMTAFGLGYSPLGRGLLYRRLKEKGYDDEILKRSGLFSYKEEAVPGDKFWNRVMFPIIDQNGKVIAFGGRLMGEGRPKYLNSPETPVFSKGKNLFSLNLAKQSREDYFILCEGYMDVIALYQAGFKNAVASLGTALTLDQARLISRYKKSVVIMYDSDEAGLSAANKAIPILKEAGVTIRIASLSPYKDPDDFVKGLGAEELGKRIERATSSFEFFLGLGEKEFDISVPEERIALIQRMAEKLVEIEDRLERETYLIMLAERYHLSIQTVMETVNRIGLDKDIREGYRAAEEKIRARKPVKREEGLLKSERLFISCLVENPSLYPKLKPWIKAEDFSAPYIREAVKLLFSGLEAGEEIKPGFIISRYETEEEQEEVAALFGENTLVQLEEEDRKKAISELILGIKRASIERRIGEAAESGDMERLSLIMREQKELSEIKIVV